MFFLPISPRDGKQKGRVNDLMVKQLQHLQDEKLGQESHGCLVTESVCELCSGLAHVRGIR